MEEQKELFEVNPEMRGALKPGTRSAYALAGKATITVRNPETGVRFTFKIKKWLEPYKKNDPNAKPTYYVRLLSGPDNENDYTYLGAIYPDYRNFERTTGTKISDTAESMKAIKFLAGTKHIQPHWEDPRLEVWHEGACGRCGRKLTVPESIATGLGPYCEQQI